MKLNKKYKCGLYLLLLLALPIFSFGDDNALFAKGNQAYAKAQYQQAISAYQQIVDGGYRSATVYFNLGDAYYKQGDIASAILYYEKAHKLAPGDDDINANIRFANSKTSDRVEPEPEFFVTRWWDALVLHFSVGTLAVLSVIFFLAGFIGLIGYLFTNSVSLKKLSFCVGVLLIFFGLTAIFFSNRQVNYFNGQHQAIIFTPAVVVKNTPDAGAKALFIIHEGTKVTIRQTNNGWMEIELPNGNAGWIAVSDAKTI
jgi:tetratricopeptide (TPR) repeat protein